MIDNSFGGSYDLPTLDDPTRANTGPGGADARDGRFLHQLHLLRYSIFQYHK
jgi:hypothetical protein